MTPLARKLARELLDHSAEAPTPAATVATSALNGAHFFEVTEALPIINEIGKAVHKAEKEGSPCAPCTFLPAPNTWIEWRPEGSGRIAISLRESGGLASAVSFYAATGERVPTVGIRRGTYVVVDS